MILEAFSQTLQQQFEQSGRASSPEHILHGWLYSFLSQPVATVPIDRQAEEDVVLQAHVGRVLHQELALNEVHGQIWFEPKSVTGQQLLDSLYSYCKSYENWQFRRWLHTVNASDFTFSGF